MKNSHFYNVKEAFLYFKKSASYEKSDIQHLNDLLNSCLPEIQNLLLNQGQQADRENITYLSFIFLVCNNHSGIKTLSDVKYNEITINQAFINIQTKFFSYLNETNIHCSDSFSVLLTRPDEYENMSRERVLLHNLHSNLLNNDKLKDSTFNICNKSDEHLKIQFMRTIQNTVHQESFIKWVSKQEEYKQIYYVNTMLRENVLSEIALATINFLRETINNDYENKGNKSKWFILQPLFCQNKVNFDKYKNIINFVNQDTFILNEYVLEKYKNLDKNNFEESVADIKNVIIQHNYIANFSVEPHGIYSPFSYLLKHIVKEDSQKLSDYKSKFIRCMIQNTKENFFEAEGSLYLIRDLIRSRNINETEKTKFMETLLNNQYFSLFVSRIFVKNSEYILECRKLKEHYIDYTDNKLINFFTYAFEKNDQELLIPFIERQLCDEKTRQGTLLFLWNGFVNDHITSLATYSQKRLRDIISDKQKTEDDLEIFHDIVNLNEGYSRPVEEEVSVYKIELEKRTLINTLQTSSKKNTIRL